MTAIAGHRGDAAVTAHNEIFINGEWVPSSGLPPFGLTGQEVQNVLQRPLRMGR